MADTANLDRIVLDDFSSEFKQSRGKSVNYFHWHQCLELLYIQNGVGIVVVDEHNYTAKPGRLFVFPEGRIHKVMVENSDKNRYDRFIIHVDVTMLTEYIRPFHNNATLFTSVSASDAKVSIYDFYDASEKERFESILTSFLEIYNKNARKTETVALLMLNILEFLPKDIASQPTTKILTSSKIMKYIEERFTQKITLDGIAASLNVSSSYASRIFKNETGGTIQEYIMIKRIKHACELLEYSALSVAEIAQKSGFNHLTYFSKCFSEIMGESPLQYKKKITR